MSDTHMVHIDRWLKSQTGKAQVQTQANTQRALKPSWKEGKCPFLKYSLFFQHCTKTH